MSEVMKIKWSRYIPHYPTPKQLAFLSLPHFEAMFGGAAGGGKLLAEDGVVLTPFGFKKNTDLKVGDLINNPDGSVCKIIQLKAWEELPRWVVHFHDGTSTEVCEEHLWLAWRSGKRVKKNGKELFSQDSAEVVTTRQLDEWLESANKAKANGSRPNWPLIPVCKPQKFNVTYRKRTNIDPYFLGAMLGDGSFTGGNITFTSSTEDYEQHWVELFQGDDDCVWELKKSQPTTGSVRFRGFERKELKNDLKKLRLWGCNSHTKFIPRQYLYSTIEDRISILQGLMDTDGYVDDRGQLYYCSVSEQLRNDVKFLVQSLGGTATFCKEFELYINLPTNVVPFRLQRKIERLTPTSEPYRRVVKIEKSGTVRGRCLSVSHPNGLYITNDFIVTHNSDCLLMIALQYFDTPGYKCIVFRRTIRDANLSGSIQSRATEWLASFIKTGEVKYDRKTNTFTSIEGGSITFGYLDKVNDELSYQGSENHVVIFDELTQITPKQFLYLFSRCRRNKNDNSDIPLRVRSACNPGGPAHGFVKSRYQIKKGTDGEFRSHHPTRMFIQSTMFDNPHLEHVSYGKNLEELDPTTRDQLKYGDWDSSPDSLFRDEWFKHRFMHKGEYFTFHNPDTQYHETFHKSQIFWFTSVDSAASEKTGVDGRVLMSSGNHEPCWSNCAVFGMTPDFQLFWFDNWRGQVTIPNFIHKICEITRAKKTTISVQGDTGLDKGIIQGCQAKGIQVYPIDGIQDKVIKATSAMLRAEAGKIWLPPKQPEIYPWLEDLESELFVWTGIKKEICDQIDCLAQAASYVAQKAHRIDSDPTLASGSHSAQPLARSGLWGSEGHSGRTSPFMGSQIGL